MSTRQKKVMFVALLSVLLLNSGASGDLLKGTMPDVSFLRLDGKRVSLPAITDKKVALVVFSAFYCDECSKLVKYLNKLEKRFKDKDFVLLTVISRENAEKLHKYKKEKRVGYTILSDPSGRFLREYRIYKFPTVKLFDKNKNLIYESMVPNKGKLNRLIEQNI